MSTKTIAKEKGNRYAKVRYHIPFYSPSFFEPVKEEEEQQMVKLPVKISEEEGESRSNVTSFQIPAITQFDGNLEQVLESLSNLRSKVIRPRQLEHNEEIKLTLKYLGLICVGSATQTLLDSAKVNTWRQSTTSMPSRQRFLWKMRERSSSLWRETSQN